MPATRLAQAQGGLRDGNVGGWGAVRLKKNVYIVKMIPKAEKKLTRRLKGGAGPGGTEDENSDELAIYRGVDEYFSRIQVDKSSLGKLKNTAVIGYKAMKLVSGLPITPIIQAISIFLLGMPEMSVFFIEMVTKYGIKPIAPLAAVAIGFTGEADEYGDDMPPGHDDMAHGDDLERGENYTDDAGDGVPDEESPPDKVVSAELSDTIKEKLKDKIKDYEITMEEAEKRIADFNQIVGAGGDDAALELIDQNDKIFTMTDEEYTDFEAGISRYIRSYQGKAEIWARVPGDRAVYDFLDPYDPKFNDDWKKFVFEVYENPEILKADATFHYTINDETYKLEFEGITSELPTFEAEFLKMYVMHKNDIGYDELLKMHESGKLAKIIPEFYGHKLSSVNNVFDDIDESTFEGNSLASVYYQYYYSEHSIDDLKVMAGITEDDPIWLDLQDKIPGDEIAQTQALERLVSFKQMTIGGNGEIDHSLRIYVSLLEDENNEALYKMSKLEFEKFENIILNWDKSSHADIDTFEIEIPVKGERFYDVLNVYDKDYQDDWSKFVTELFKKGDANNQWPFTSSITELENGVGYEVELLGKNDEVITDPKLLKIKNFIIRNHMSHEVNDFEKIKSLHDADYLQEIFPDIYENNNVDDFFANSDNFVNEGINMTVPVAAKIFFDTSGDAAQDVNAAGGAGMGAVLKRKIEQKKCGSSLHTKTLSSMENLFRGMRSNLVQQTLISRCALIVCSENSRVTKPEYVITKDKVSKSQNMLNEYPREHVLPALAHANAKITQARFAEGDSTAPNHFLAPEVILSKAGEAATDESKRRILYAVSILNLLNVGKKLEDLKIPVVNRQDNSIVNRDGFMGFIALFCKAIEEHDLDTVLESEWWFMDPRTVIPLPSSNFPVITEKTDAIALGTGYSTDDMWDLLNCRGRGIKDRSKYFQNDTIVKHEVDKGEKHNGLFILQSKIASGYEAYQKVVYNDKKRLVYDNTTAILSTNVICQYLDTCIMALGLWDTGSLTHHLSKNTLGEHATRFAYGMLRRQKPDQITQYETDLVTWKTIAETGFKIDGNDRKSVANRQKYLKSLISSEHPRTVSASRPTETRDPVDIYSDDQTMERRQVTTPTLKYKENKRGQLPPIVRGTEGYEKREPIVLGGMDRSSARSILVSAALLGLSVIGSMFGAL